MDRAMYTPPPYVRPPAPRTDAVAVVGLGTGAWAPAAAGSP